MIRVISIESTRQRTFAFVHICRQAVQWSSSLFPGTVRELDVAVQFHGRQSHLTSLSTCVCRYASAEELTIRFARTVQQNERRQK